MKKSLLAAGLVVTSMNVLGMNYSEQSEQRSSVNMVSISEPSQRNELLTVSSGNTTWWSGGLEKGKEGFLRNIKEKRKKCKNREKKIKAFNSKDSNGRNMNVININAKDINGNTALLVVAETGDIEKMRLLLSRGADVNTINNNGQTALSIVATSENASQNEEILRLLFKYGANLASLSNFRNINELKSIQEKVEKERVKLTTALLSGKWPKIKKELKNWGEVNTCVSKVIKVNEEIQYLNQIGNEPILFRLVNHGNSGSIQSFISFIKDESYFVDFDIQGPDGITPLGLALQHYISSAKKQAESILEMDRLKAQMLKIEWEKVIEILLTNSTNVDKQRVKTRTTTLMQAIGGGYPEIAIDIIKKSQNINLQDTQDETALMWALDKGYVDVARAIIERGGNVDIQNVNGDTALTKAILLFDGTKEWIDMIDLLIDKSRDLNIKTKKGNNALILAIAQLANIKEPKIINDWKTIIFKLIDGTTDVSLKGSNDMNALSMAGRLQQPDIYQKLLEKEKQRQKKESDVALEALLLVQSNSIDQLKELLKKQGTISASMLSRTLEISETKVSMENSELPTNRSLWYAITNSSNPEIWQLFFDHLKNEDKSSPLAIKLKKAIELVKETDEELMEKMDSSLEKEQAESKREEAIRNKMDQKWLEGDKKTKAENSSFMNAIRTGDFHQLQTMLLTTNEKGERLISQDIINEGFLLLAEKGNKKLIDELFLDEVDIDYKDPETGNTALMLAAKNGHLEIVGDLVANGATIDANNKGYTALRFAAENGYFSVVEYLLDAGARTRYLDEILDKVNEKVAQNDPLIEDYKKIQEVLSKRQQDVSSPDSSESEGANKTWSVYFWNKVLKAYGSLDEGQKEETDRLLDEIQKNPFRRRTTSGQKPEPLYGNLSGFFSRRINGDDRLVYRVKGDRIFVVACDDHYEDLNKFSKSEIRSLSSFNNEWKKGVLIKLN